MNAVEIEEAVSQLAEAPFDPAAFPYAFLEAFGNKETTLKRLKSGNTNQSDLPGGVLQRNNIHIKVCPAGEVTATLAALRNSPATTRQKAKFVLATDGQTFEAENLENGETVACPYADFSDHFGFFLPLAGITTVKQIRENAFDIKATGRLNRLYVELLTQNPDWDTTARREDLNHFFARLIFCFFAEDTSIFNGTRLFTATIEQMSERDASNTHEVLAELFRAMNTRLADRAAAGIKSWAGQFPYVNGNLFATASPHPQPLSHSSMGEGSRGKKAGPGKINASDQAQNESAPLAHVLMGEGLGVRGESVPSSAPSSPALLPRSTEGEGSPMVVDVPRFSRSARSYLLHVGNLDWTKINPDIFGSMIQAVADDEERGALGMHYTSVPNILKVLNPLFLDDLRAQLEAAGDNARKLLNLRNRLARIRVFDPACGSGNFLVIAYKEMREIEAEINRRRGEGERRTEIPLTNFRGIEIRHFSAEIARLALIIAEYQCDVLYRGQQLALAEFLPLEAANWITCGNALRLDWLSIWPTGRTGIKVRANDLFSTPLDQAEIDFENAGEETYICGNPPYKGGTEQTAEQKSDMAAVFADKTANWKSLDYVCGWFFKFAEYAMRVPSTCAFVSTNSIAQGEQVARLWPLLLGRGLSIIFAHTSFKWANLASHNAGVTVVIVGLGEKLGKAILFENSDQSIPSRREVDNVCPYLVPHANVLVSPLTDATSDIAEIVNGNKPADGGHLIFDHAEADLIRRSDARAAPFIRRFVGAADSIQGRLRYCLWILDHEAPNANSIEAIAERTARVREMRADSPKELTQRGASTPHAFQQVRQSGNETCIVIPRHSSVSRSHLPISLFPAGTIIGDGAFAIYNPELWNFSILGSRIHLVWIAAVCGKIKTDYRYSSTLGWNTFPVPTLTEQNKADLTRCAEEILLAREAHFPATIADLYDPEHMPGDLRAAHEQNDETLERIYLGRRFKNDTERLEKLFELYTQMTARQTTKPQGKRKNPSPPAPLP